LALDWLSNIMLLKWFTELLVHIGFNRTPSIFFSYRALCPYQFSSTGVPRNPRVPQKM